MAQGHTDGKWSVEMVGYMRAKEGVRGLKTESPHLPSGLGVGREEQSPGSSGLLAPNIAPSQKGWPTGLPHLGTPLPLPALSGVPWNPHLPGLSQLCSGPTPRVSSQVNESGGPNM